jgi:hypothetical protein
MGTFMRRSTSSPANASVDISALVNDIVSSVKKLDEILEYQASDEDPIIGLQVFPGVTLTLDYLLIKHRSNISSVEYTCFILLLLEVLAIRGVRYSGQGTLSASSSFIIHELLRQYKGAQIADELLGSFITKGKVQNKTLVEHQTLTHLFLALIRPFYKNGFIIPSPLSYITYAIITKNGQYRKYILSPATVIAIIKELKFVKNYNVLGTPLTGFLSNNASILVYDPYSNEIREITIPILLLKNTCPTFDDYFNYLKTGTSNAIITNLLGMFIFGKSLPIANVKTDTRDVLFLAFSESCPYIEFEAFAIFSSVQQSFLAMNLSKRRHHYGLCIPHNYVQEFVATVSRKFHNIIQALQKVQSASILEQHIESNIKRKIQSEFIIQENDNICIPAPPLIPLSLTTHITIKDMWTELKRLHYLSIHNKFMFELEIIKIRQEESWRRQMLSKIKKPWGIALQIQSEYAKKHQLWYII